MSTVNGEIFRGVSSGYRTIDITYPDSYENLLETPIVISNTTNPGWAGAQVSYTFSESDFPIINGDVEAVLWCYLIHVCGYGEKESSDVFFRPYLNSQALFSQYSTGVSYNSGFTYAFYGNGVKLGDVIKVAIWRSGVNVSYNYLCVSVFPSRLRLSKTLLMEDVTYNCKPFPVPKLGNPSQSSLTLFRVIPPSDSTKTVGAVPITVNTMLSGVNDVNSKNLGYVNYGDSSAGCSIGGGYQNPWYYSNFVPYKITYRMINIENKSL